jgi:DNA topoisomerase-1
LFIDYIAIAQELKAMKSVEDKLVAYNRANREVALLCNHRKTPPKNFDLQMANLQEKVCIVTI